MERIIGQCHGLLAMKIHDFFKLTETYDIW